ncbi:C2 domain-containing protein 2 isoform X2 [Clupea harengus]|uniref:C2 domain-containing protein 2 isoform X2 n=1 Tax=Clupea harengus TaxID=7950 RepID=A0A6P8FI22_CLUHA|nr:C2 domain-containing protein 2 isoform X2 [Clupea harengus]
MSFLESVLSFFGLGDLQWLCMITLFIASIVTLIIYFVQYYLDNVTCESETSGNTTLLSEEANTLLNWALSLKTWKTEWRKAWVRALSDQSKLTGNSLQLSFEEDGLQSTDLVLSQVSGIRKQAGGKVMRCQVAGEKLQFSVRAQPAGTVSTEPQQYTVTISPLQLQLDLQLTEANGEVRLNWGLLGLEPWDLQLSPCSSQGGSAGFGTSAVRERLRQVLCRVRPSAVLSSRPAQPGELRDARSKPQQVVSPPKPPRAHEWKLLVKNIRVTCKPEENAAGIMNPQCVLQLNDPPQRLCSSCLKDTDNPSWDQPFIFELNGRSKELNMQLLNVGNSQESSLLAQVSVPFDLVKKHPKGQQTFALKTKDVVIGTLTTEFTYLEPSEVRTWQTPTPAASKRVEMDRTVMPCGTVVTTITAVKSKPGRPLPPGLMETPMKPPTKAKLSERRVSEQPCMLGATVSKALSSSDTELLMLNGTDPVAEAAIRQLQESAKLKLKSPVKKSTIIISGVTKSPLSQDEELALMAGYAAAMDASLSQVSEEESAVRAPVTAAAVGELNAGVPQARDPLEGPSEGPAGAEAAVGAAVEDWESQTGEDPDADKASLSLCMSETGSKKGKGSFLHKSAKLFFRRRHQRKDPGMSQSHNDLVYLEQPEQAEQAVAGERERQRRTATLRRIINRKLLHKGSKSRANGCAEPSA